MGIEYSGGKYFQTVALVDGLGNPTATAANPLRTVTAGAVSTGAAAERDAFGRFRVSGPNNLFSGKNELDAALYPDKWTQFVVGTGTHIHLPNESAVSHTVTALGDVSEQSSAWYIPYEPGISQLALLTGILNHGTATAQSDIGLFDVNDGVMFRCPISGVEEVVIRGSMTGLPVENVISRTAWTDKLDGTGASGLNIDFTKTQILVIDYEWLGVGVVRFGVSIGNSITYFHSVDHANSITTVYMKSGTLPVSYRIQAIAAGAASIKQICATVVAEGGAGTQRAGLGQHIASNSVGAIAAAGIMTPIISLQVKPQFPVASGQFNRNSIKVIDLDLMSFNKELEWGLYQNAVLTGPVWVSAGTDDGVNIDTAATAVNVATARRVAGGFAAKKSALSAEILDFINPLSVNRFTNVGSTFTLAASGMNANASTTVGSIMWRELR